MKDTLFAIAMESDVQNEEFDDLETVHTSQATNNPALDPLVDVFHSPVKKQTTARARRLSCCRVETELLRQRRDINAQTWRPPMDPNASFEDRSGHLLSSWPLVLSFWHVACGSSLPSWTGYPETLPQERQWMPH